MLSSLVPSEVDPQPTHLLICCTKPLTNVSPPKCALHINYGELSFINQSHCDKLDISSLSAHTDELANLFLTHFLTQNSQTAKLTRDLL